MRNSLTHLQQQQTLIPNDVNLCLYYFTNSHNRIYNNNNNNPICKAPECQKTSVALGVLMR